MKTAALLISICVLLGGLGFVGYKFINLRESLEETNEIIQSLQENIDQYQIQVSNLEEDLARLEDNLENTENRLNFVRSELQKLQEGSRFELHDPTYNEVQDFIDEDTTDDNDYDRGEYVCVDYASDVNNNAEKEGIRCAFVSLRFIENAHALVAFQTVDKGLVYVEPQYDIIITSELKPGMEYYEVLDRNTEFQIKGLPNDVIQRVIITW